MLMCSKEEAVERESLGFLSRFECTAATRELKGKSRRVNPLLAVTTYQRAAAGKSMRRKEDLRSLLSLEKTVEYLIEVYCSVVCEKGLDESIAAYEFVENRLRAVRQELTMQELSPRTVQLLERASRFYIVSDFAMTGVTANQFNANNHNDQMHTCFSQLPALYEEGETRSSDELLSCLVLMNLPLSSGDLRSLVKRCVVSCLCTVETTTLCMIPNARVG